MAIYKIPLYERFTELENSFCGRQQCLHIDKVGLFVSYPTGREDLLTPENIRRYLIGRRRTWCLVEADSPEKAVETFYKEWEGASIGGETRESKALWIADEEHDEPISEYPYCGLLHKNKRDEFVCGDEEDCGGCILEGYDSWEGCVIRAYGDLLWLLGEEKKLPIKTIEGGLKVLMVADVMVAAKELSKKKKVVVEEKKRTIKD